MTYEEFANLPSSEKYTLCTIEAIQEAKIFTFFSGSTYSKITNHFVVGVKDDGQDLAQSLTMPLSSGEWYVDAENKTLYTRMFDDSDPRTRNVAICYRLFFSDSPSVLPFDLANGVQVEWDSRLSSVSSVGQKLDDENTGIVLENSSTITIINQDGFFDEIFDTLIFENQVVEIFSWSPLIPVSEAKRIFKGYVQEKSFSMSSVSFKVQDVISKLQESIIQEIFIVDPITAGKIAEPILGTPKRRIFGRVKQLKCIGLDNIIDGYDLGGTISASSGGNTVTGAGTTFLQDLSPGDEILFTVDEDDYKITVATVTNDTSFTVESQIEVSFSGISATINPLIPYSRKNRRWHVAGHLLRNVSTTVTEVVGINRFRVGSTKDLFEGDIIRIDTSTFRIRRISGDIIVTSQAASPLPFIGTPVVKSAISLAMFESKELIAGRDYIFLNYVAGTQDAFISLNSDAEFNLTEPVATTVQLLFTNGFRSITTADVVDLRTIAKPRDYIRKDSVTETTYYSILDVKEQEITLREPYIGTNQTVEALIKNVKYIQDDSLITVDTFGMESNGEWIKTPSDVVKYIIENDVGITEIDTDTFDKANAQCEYIVSMALPESIGDKSPKCRDVITKINESVFGSLYINRDYEVCYSILNATKPDTLVPIKDDDIISFSMTSRNKIINKVVASYRPFVDLFTGEETFDVYEHTSDFVDRMIGIRKQSDITLYLYEPDKAKIIAQRYAFFNSLSNSNVRIKTKLQFALSSVNDKVFLDLTRLYKRYGGRNRKKIGIISGISKNGSDTEIEVIDLGNIFNRVPSISPNTALDYGTAEEEEIIKYGYIVDNNTLTPDNSSEQELGNNLIG